MTTDDTSNTEPKRERRGQKSKHPAITYAPKDKSVYGGARSRGAIVWAKSGTRSLVYDSPYEHWEIWHHPVMLSSATIPDVMVKISSRLRAMIDKRSKRKMRSLTPEDLIQAHITCVYGVKKGSKGPGTIRNAKEARNAYRGNQYVTTLHTDRWTIGGLNDFLDELWRQLDLFLDKPSKEPWIIVTQITFRSRLGDEKRLFRGRKNIDRRRYSSETKAYEEF